MTDDDRTLKECIEEEMVVGPAPDSEPETRGRAVSVSTAECAEMRRRLRTGGTTIEIGTNRLYCALSELSNNPDIGGFIPYPA